MPLIRFTSAPRIMGAFASPPWLRGLASCATLLIIGLNAWLVMRALAPGGAGLGSVALGLTAALCAALLAWIAWVPLRLAPNPLHEDNPPEIKIPDNGAIGPAAAVH